MPTLEGRFPLTWRGRHIGFVEDLDDESTLRLGSKRVRIYGRFVPLAGPAVEAFCAALRASGEADVELNGTTGKVFREPTNVIEIQSYQELRP